MNDNIIYMSKEAYEKLQQQLMFLKTTKRKEISAQLQEAHMHGDVGDNAEYEAAKEKQDFNEMKIRELEDKLARSRIIKEEDLPDGKVVLGTTVSLIDLDTNEELKYTLVSEVEADPSQDKISVSSPVGKGLLGHEEGDIVEINVPKGKIKYEIKKITKGL
jgi:transcription elongation factor GreA